MLVQKTFQPTPAERLRRQRHSGFHCALPIVLLLYLKEAFCCVTVVPNAQLEAVELAVVMIQIQLSTWCIEIQRVVSETPEPVHFQYGVVTLKPPQAGFENRYRHQEFGVYPVHQPGTRLFLQRVPVIPVQRVGHRHVHLTFAPYSRVASRLSSTSPVLAPEPALVIVRLPSAPNARVFTPPGAVSSTSNSKAFVAKP